MKEQRQEILELAVKAGFEESQYIGALPAAPDMIWYLWMCECQKWLREEKSIFIHVENNYDTMGKYNRGFIPCVNGSFTWDIGGDDFESHTEAFEEGLKEALQLIKQK